MSRNDPIIDQILRELEQQSAGEKPSGSDADIDALVRDLMEERINPGIDPKSGQELPTRVFLRSQKKRPLSGFSPSAQVAAGGPSDSEKPSDSGDPAPAKPPAFAAKRRRTPSTEAKAPPAAGSQPPSGAESPSRPAAAPAGEAARSGEEQPPASQPLPESKSTLGNESTPRTETPPPPAPSAGTEAPAPKGEPEMVYTTGPIAIDVDAIRADSPPPRAIPAQPVEKPQPQAPPEEPPFRPLTREQAAKRQPSPLAAPCFRREVSAAGEDPRPVFQRLAAQATARGWILVLLFIFSLVLSLLMDQSRRAADDWIPSRILMGVMTALGAGAGATALPVVGGGLLSLFKWEQNRDTLPALCWLAALGQTVTLTIWPKGFIHPAIQCYLPVGILVLAAVYLGRLLTAKAGLKNANALQKPGGRYAPHLVEDTQLAAQLTRGLPEEGELPAVNRRTAAVADLLETALAADSSDRISRLLSLTGLAAATLAALTGFFFTRQKHFAVTLFTGVLSVFTPLLAMLCTAQPLSLISRQMEKQGAMVCGELACQRYQKAGSLLLDARQLVPPEAVSLAAIKTFEGTRIDEVLVDAASVLQNSGSILAELFGKVIGQRKSMLHTPDSLEIEDGRGMVGWIEGRRILIGSRALMTAYGIQIPRREYERRFTAKGHDLVYLASAGELSAIFVLTLTPPEAAVQAAQTLTDNNLGIILSTVDSFLTAERLGELFAVNPALVKILPQRLAPYAQRLSTDVRAKQALLVNNGGIDSCAQSLSAPRRLRAMIGLNRALILTALILGCILMLIFALLDAFSHLTPVLLSGYLLIWPLISWALQKLLHR